MIIVCLLSDNSIHYIGSGDFWLVDYCGECAESTYLIKLMTVDKKKLAELVFSSFLCMCMCSCACVCMFLRMYLGWLASTLTQTLCSSFPSGIHLLNTHAHTHSEVDPSKRRLFPVRYGKMTEHEHSSG